MLVLLGAAMGAQNASVRTFGVSDMATTVLTLTLTGVAADSRLAGGSARHTVRRLGSVLLMLVGAVAGALLGRSGLGWPVSGAALCAVAAVGLIHLALRRRDSVALVDRGS
jgi:uncharacterized membrane protein YoaK (UPF0700 family)